MKSKQSWQFSCEPSALDLNRIVREAGKDARVVRVTVGNDVFTAVNQDWLDSTGNSIKWKDETPPRYIGSDMEKPCRVGDSIRIPLKSDYRKWALIKGDLVGLFLDRIKNKVEVF